MLAKLKALVIGSLRINDQILDNQFAAGHSYRCSLPDVRIFVERQPESWMAIGYDHGAKMVVMKQAVNDSEAGRMGQLLPWSELQTRPSRRDAAAGNLLTNLSGNSLFLLARRRSSNSSALSRAHSNTSLRLGIACRRRWLFSRHSM